MNQNCGRKPYGEVRRLPAHGRHKNDKREVEAVVDVERLLAEDNRLKRQARGGQFCGKKSPRLLITPSSLRGRSREPPHSWLTAEPIVYVNIVTGEVLIFRWPLE
jgi:hypothetical protein